MKKSNNIKVGVASAITLAAFPIANESILEGKPVAKIWINAQTADKRVTQGIWDCTTGSFRWDYTWDEFVMILAGEATVTEENGSIHTLAAGDFAYFPSGLKTVWTVKNYVKKTFTLRTTEPLNL